jgi:acyl-CoA dehydrogenase
MDFSLSAAAQDTSARMWAFMREEVFPAEPEWGWPTDAARSTS